MISLRPLTDADLPVVRLWFEDVETRHWLGGWNWPRGKLALAGPGRHTLLGLIDGLPAGLLDIEVDAAQRAAFAIVVSPTLRRLGLGRALTVAMMADRQFAQVDEWFAGVESGNVGSRQLLIGCGFARVTDEDADGFTYHALRRRGWPQLPWTPWGPLAAPRPAMHKLAARSPL